jgi:surface protein
MFNDASSFNGDISNWNVSKSRGMDSMFMGATKFDQDISAWNVSKVTLMSNMFDGAALENSDKRYAIHSSFKSNNEWPYDWRWVAESTVVLRKSVWGWVKYRKQTLAEYGHISDWDTSHITIMNELFKEKPYFDDDISSWNVSSVENMSGMFEVD